MAGSLYNSVFGSGGNAAAGTTTFGNSVFTGTLTANSTVTLNGNSAITLADLRNVAVGTTNGTILAANNAQKLGLWGATPIVQPAGTGELLGLNGNAATAANATNMNTNGNIGSTYYSFIDVVKAMKQAGVLKS
jgi:hypothetical protein